MQPGRASPRGLCSRALRPWRCPRRVRGCRCGCPAGRTAPPPPVRTATFPEIALVSLLGAPDLSGGRTLDGVRPVMPSMLSADPQPKGGRSGEGGSLSGGTPTRRHLSVETMRHRGCLFRFAWQSRLWRHQLLTSWPPPRPSASRPGPGPGPGQPFSLQSCSMSCENSLVYE